MKAAGETGDGPSVTSMLESKRDNKISNAVNGNNHI